MCSASFLCLPSNSEFGSQYLIQVNLRGIASIKVARVSRRNEMIDTIFVAGGVIAFALTVLYIVACEHM